MQNILRIKHKIYILTMLRKTKHSRKPFLSYSKYLNHFKCIHFHYLEILYLGNSAFQKHIHNKDEQRRSRNSLLKLCAKELRWLRVKVDVSIPNQSRKRVSLRSLATDSLLSPLMLWFPSRSDWESVEWWVRSQFILERSARLRLWAPRNLSYVTSRVKPKRGWQTEKAVRREEGRALAHQFGQREVGRLSSELRLWRRSWKGRGSAGTAPGNDWAECMRGGSHEAHERGTQLVSWLCLCVPLDYLVLRIINETPEWNKRIVCRGDFMLWRHKSWLQI